MSFLELLLQYLHFLHFWLLTFFSLSATPKPRDMRTLIHTVQTRSRYCTCDQHSPRSYTICSTKHHIPEPERLIHRTKERSTSISTQALTPSPKFDALHLARATVQYILTPEHLMNPYQKAALFQLRTESRMLLGWTSVSQAACVAKCSACCLCTAICSSSGPTARRSVGWICLWETCWAARMARTEASFWILVSWAWRRRVARSARGISADWVRCCMRRCIACSQGMRTSCARRMCSMWRMHAGMGARLCWF
jgi:hypothetical protein